VAEGHNLATQTSRIVWLSYLFLRSLRVETSKLKSLEDFPQFTVTGVRRGATSDTGYTRFELDGGFDRVVETLDPYWFWLLFGDREYLYASLKSLDNETQAAILTSDEEIEPKVVGHSLAYLSRSWQAFHVWMVLDPRWVWERKVLPSTDAVAEDYESKDVSIVDGREVSVWTKLEPVEGRGDQNRHYPATDQTLPPRHGTYLVAAGWDHEHCELCHSHLDAGHFGYRDLGEHWTCEKCCGRYVATHDLAFVDEL
jgi:hypothetical protein